MNAFQHRHTWVCVYVEKHSNKAERFSRGDSEFYFYLLSCLVSENADTENEFSFTLIRISTKKPNRTELEKSN